MPSVMPDAISLFVFATLVLGDFKRHFYPLIRCIFMIVTIVYLLVSR